MKLYLHCGYHKTGSSFLQTLFARNRGLLKENGYYFPVASREYDMLKGNVSPGNGPELASALKKNDRQKASDLIEAYTLEARKSNCDSILLSSENFFHAFENQHALECLMTVTSKKNIQGIHGLVYFRDPVSHALSTFKHRAKNGKIEDFDIWLENEYETMKLTEQFLNIKDKFPIHWTLRKYSRHSEKMAGSTFSDWLKIEKPKIPEDARVNTSLTLSELNVLRALNGHNTDVIPFVQKAFYDLNNSEKGNDDVLNKKYSSIAYGILSKYKGPISNLNALLPAGEALNFSQPEEATSSVVQNDITLTSQQVKALADAVKSATNSNHPLNKGINLFFKVVEKIRRETMKVKGH